MESTVFHFLVDYLHHNYAQRLRFINFGCIYNFLDNAFYFNKNKYLNVIIFRIKLFILKWEKILSVESNSSRRAPLIKSIHNLFNDAKWKPDDEKLKTQLFKHSYIDFQRLIKSFDLPEETI